MLNIECHKKREPKNDQNKMTQNGYAHPEAVVSTQWVEEHLDSPRVRILECNEDVMLYDTGHIPKAGNIDWYEDLNDETMRDVAEDKRFAALMSRLGITRDTTVVFYGDKYNWWACYAFWVFSLFGHPDLRIMNGGREKWENEGRRVEEDIPDFKPSDYPIVERDDSKHRAFFQEVLQLSQKNGLIIDVRSAEEYKGYLLHMPDYPQEGSLRAGHIVGAKHVLWRNAVRLDGTFKSVDKLREIYFGEAQVNPNEDVITYCRIGERSAHSWFVLKYLLGVESAKNYDGSWAEWGNMVRTPIAKVE